MGLNKIKSCPEIRLCECCDCVCVRVSPSNPLLKERFLPPSLHTFRTVPEDQKHLILNFPPNLKTERTTQAKPELVRRPTEKKINEPSQQQSLSTIKIVSHL